jgi:hypothetical protein
MRSTRLAHLMLLDLIGAIIQIYYWNKSWYRHWNLGRHLNLPKEIECLKLNVLVHNRRTHRTVWGCPRLGLASWWTRSCKFQCLCCQSCVWPATWTLCTPSGSLESNIWACKKEDTEVLMSLGPVAGTNTFTDGHILLYNLAKRWIELVVAESRYWRALVELTWPGEWQWQTSTTVLNAAVNWRVRGCTQNLPFPYVESCAAI